MILIVVTAGALALLSYAAVSVNQVQVAEERALVSRRLDRNRTQIVTDITSASVWDDAYVHLGPRLDTEWADINIGGYYSTYLGHDLSVVLDAADRPAYAWRGEGRVEPAQLARLLKNAAPLIRKVRDEEALRLRGEAPPKPYGMEAVIKRSGILRSEGRHYLVGVTNVVAETADVELRPGPNALVVSAREMDETFLAEMDQDLGLTKSHFAAQGSREPARVPLIDVNGFTISDLAWAPKTPGVTVLQQAIPVFISALLVVLAAAAALALRIRGVFRELSANDAALNRTLEQLVRARDAADSANIAKSQFLANMSHEIRTPLNGILGMAQVMARDELTPQQRDRLDVVRASGQTLLILLNDILDLSKIEAGRFEIDNHEFDLVEAIHTVCDPFANLAAQKDVAFRIEIDEAAHGLWWGDGARLRQVIANLASNAVKFTDAGEVMVKVGRDQQGLRFAVEDSGIGIPAERIGDLFQKFSQVDASTTRQFGGTGLGLAICRELVEMLGGHLTVESQFGQGSRFAFDLALEWRGPVRTARATPRAAKTTQNDRKIRILAAEDNPINRLILASLLEPLDAELRLTTNGREAVEAFAEGFFDLVLMDIQMPLMNGIEAAAEIRRLEAARGLAAVPILALSANVMSHQVTEYLAAGMSGSVPKPIEAENLFAAIETALAQTATSAAA